MLYCSPSTNTISPKFPAPQSCIGYPMQCVRHLRWVNHWRKSPNLDRDWQLLITIVSFASGGKSASLGVRSAASLTKKLPPMASVGFRILMVGIFVNGTVIKSSSSTGKMMVLNYMILDRAQLSAIHSIIFNLHSSGRGLVRERQLLDCLLEVFSFPTQHHPFLRQRQFSMK